MQEARAGEQEGEGGGGLGPRCARGVTKGFVWWVGRETCASDGGAPGAAVTELYDGRAAVSLHEVKQMKFECK